MTRRTTLKIAVVAAGAALALGAMAGPGGGGGGGGMGHGGGMGMGSSMGAGHRFGMSNPSNMGANPGNSGVSSHSATSKLGNAKLDTALTNALTKAGIAIPGGDLKTACSGFRNLGGCISALHVANNLNLPGGFTALKGLVTGSSAISLGKAISQLDANADSTAAVKTANGEANADLQAASKG